MYYPRCYCKCESFKFMELVSARDCGCTLRFSCNDCGEPIDISYMPYKSKQEEKEIPEAEEAEETE